MTFEGYDIELTEAAESDIDDTYEYIAEVLGNPDAASALADELEIQIEKICKRPETGKLVENEFLRRNVWRFLVKSYIAYYIIDTENGKIVILRFVYSGRDQEKIVREL